MAIKNQELRQIKALAGAILSQRSEIEEFFIEALNEVSESESERAIEQRAESARGLRRHYQKPFTEIITTLF